MLAIQTILHPTDFSDRSRNAFPLACALARDYGARLVVLHVGQVPTVLYGEGVLPPDPQVLLQDEKEQLNHLLVPDMNVRAERRFEIGDPTAEILRVAEEIDADLIVMGTHGRTGLTRLLMGSVAEQVVRKATCPVLTVTGHSPVIAAAGSSQNNGLQANDAVDEASEESFPASDPPAWIGHPR